MEYTQSQWILFFFFYCFLGWIWESCYVSVKQREWINRGFLHGPFLPIYGFGAIVVLWLTLPVRDNPVLVFLLGLLGADILEYCTGTAMEAMFHVRYWDYSDKPFNLNGHICLYGALLWGIFSVALIEIIHPPVERLILSIPAVIADPLSMTGIALFAVDVTSSVRSALDLRDLLEKIGENNEIVAALEARLDSAASGFTRTSEEFRENIRSIGSSIRENHFFYQRKKKEDKQTRKKFLAEMFQDYRQKKTSFFLSLNEKAGAAVKEIQAQLNLTMPENEKSRMSKLLSELEEVKKKLEKTELELISWKNREYREAASIIRRNPSAVSKKFKEAFEEIKALAETKED